MRKIWLDDIRPAPIGWDPVKTAEEAIEALKAGDVEAISLDHDLGACEVCMAKWRDSDIVSEMPNCEHFGTGYTVVCWMEEHNIWPNRVMVHSANPVGRARMLQVIRRRDG